MMNDNEYQCAVCKGIFTFVRNETWSQEKADDEYQKLFPGEPTKNRDIICEDCWNFVRPNRTIISKKE